MNRRCFTLLLFILCLPVILFALGDRDVQTEMRQNTMNDETENRIRVTGRVRLVGNEPFTELVITGPEMQWYIEKSEVAGLKNLQQRTVTAEGVETVTQMIFANGLPGGERRTLSQVRIISVN